MILNAGSIFIIRRTTRNETGNRGQNGQNKERLAYKILLGYISVFRLRALRKTDKTSLPILHRKGFRMFADMKRLTTGVL